MYLFLAFDTIIIEDPVIKFKKLFQDLVYVVDTTTVRRSTFKILFEI